jgi:hypothetical protein
VSEAKTLPLVMAECARRLPNHARFHAGDCLTVELSADDKDAGRDRVEAGAPLVRRIAYASHRSEIC